MERSRSAMVNSKRAALESTKPRFWEGMACENRRNDSSTELSVLARAAEEGNDNGTVPSSGSCTSCPWAFTRLWMVMELPRLPEDMSGWARLGSQGGRQRRTGFCYRNVEGAMDTKSVCDGSGEIERVCVSHQLPESDLYPVIGEVEIDNGRSVIRTGQQPGSAIGY